jgi:hypothetical protein
MMRRDTKVNGSAANKAYGRLAADRKKVVIAVVLIGVMVFMWVRVIAGEGPEEAGAAVLQPPANPGPESDATVQVHFVDLPIVQGKNDVLHTDFFAADGWQEFGGAGQGRNGSGLSSVIVNEGAEEAIRRVAGRLNLQAILMDRTPQAFINDKLLLVGDKLSVEEGDNVYEFEVVEIRENMVLVKCKDAEITLKLAKVVEERDS